MKTASILYTAWVKTIGARRRFPAAAIMLSAATAGLLAVSSLWAPGVAVAQQVRMATPVQSAADGSSAGSTSGAPPAGANAPPGYSYPVSPPPPAPGGSYVPPGGGGPVAAPPGAGGTYVAPGPAPNGYTAPPTPVPGTPGAPPPGYGAPNAPTLAPYTVPPGAAGPPPGAALGTIQPAPGTFDPYASPGGSPQPLLPQEPYYPGAGPELNMGLMQKFIQHVDLDFQWFAGNGDHELGLDNVGLSCTFAFPLWNVATPFLVTPGFAVHYWSGPVSVPGPPPPADLPARTYDGYIDTAWNPWFDAGQTWGAELDFRIGMYSDFDILSTESIRYMGKAEAVLHLWPHTTVKAGVWYLDRLDVKMLPAGGICWSPNEEVHFDILFPNPKITKRLACWGTTEWWVYGRGEYGVGSWTITRNSGLPRPAPTDGTFDQFDYNDIEIAVGLEFKTIRQATGHIEAGLSCDRQLVYKSNSPSDFYPNNTVFVGAGLAY